MGSAQGIGGDAHVGTGRRLRRRGVVAAVAVIAALLAAAYTVTIGSIASTTLMFGDGKPHGCPTPAEEGWAYEAVNYDIALDRALPRDNPDYLRDCPNDGWGTAGTEVVSADGTRLAGWYIPSGDGDDPTVPTVVIVHGWGVSKSDALKFAVPVHENWNLLVIDTRYAGRSSGDWMSFGVLEHEDVRAMLDWLERTKHPSKIAVIGDSGGAAASATLARTDPRIAALVLESAHARLTTSLHQEFSKDPRGNPTALTVPIGMAAYWLRTGAWLGDADPLDAIADLGHRPLAISYGTADTRDVPQESALVLYDAAVAAGVPVELHACEGAVHGEPPKTCPEAYRDWLNAFLERSIGNESEAAV